MPLPHPSQPKSLKAAAQASIRSVASGGIGDVFVINFNEVRFSYGSFQGNHERPRCSVIVPTSLTVRELWALPKPEGNTGPHSYFEYLKTVQQNDNEHGDAFEYKTVNSDAAEGVIARTTGVSAVEYLSDRIWGNAANDPMSLPACRAVADYLMAQHESPALVGQSVIDDSTASLQF